MAWEGGGGYDGKGVGAVGMCVEFGMGEAEEGVSGCGRIDARGGFPVEVGWGCMLIRLILSFCLIAVDAGER